MSESNPISLKTPTPFLKKPPNEWKTSTTTTSTTTSVMLIKYAELNVITGKKMKQLRPHNATDEYKIGPNHTNPPPKRTPKTLQTFHQQWIGTQRNLTPDGPALAPLASKYSCGRGHTYTQESKSCQSHEFSDVGLSWLFIL